jgi:hypothetical protein
MQNGVSCAEIIRIGGVSPGSLANWRRDSSSEISDSVEINSYIGKESCDKRKMKPSSFQSLPVLASAEDRPSERHARHEYTICVGNKVKIKTSSAGLSRELVLFLQQLEVS